MEIINFKPTYVKENGLVVIYGKSIPFPKEFVPLMSESGIVLLNTGQVGGNHKHPRVEVFYSIGELTISWIDENGKKHEELMTPSDNLYKLFITSPNEPHAVINNSDTPQVLVEYASEPQYGVENVTI